MSDQSVDGQLQDYRASIDNIDAALVHLLAERFKVTKAVGRYKATADLPAADPEREEQQIAAAAGARGRVRPRPGVHGEVPALHRRRGHPSPSTHRRGRIALSGAIDAGRVAIVGSTASGKSRSP